jgi:D-alanyl-D-alanine carboxypeptidase
VRQIPWGLLVESGNDAALALARHVAGGIADFMHR